MKPADLSDCADVLLQLYRHSQDDSIECFQDAALDLVRPLIPFDASIWGVATMTPLGADIHAVHLHRTSQQMLDAYERVKHEDVAAVKAASRRRATPGFHSSAGFGSGECLELARRFRHENFFVSMDQEPATRFMHWISLYRADRDAHCSEDERRRLAWLHPHLTQALSMNRRRQLDRVAAVQPCAALERAVVDLCGVVHEADPGFGPLLREEWCGAREGRLPPELMEPLLRGAQPFVGHALVVHGHAQHRLLFLSARRRCRADALTSRERTIARLIARGETHKEIARGLTRAPATVRNQIQCIYAKLEVNGIAGLIEALRPLD